MTRCGRCNTLCVSRKTMRYRIVVKNIGTVVIENFPMLVCHNPKCNAQWISGEGDQIIEDEVNRIKARN